MHEPDFTNTYKQDIESITDIQMDTYYSRNPNTEQINSRFFGIGDKYSWSSHRKEKALSGITESPMGHKIVTYTASKMYDALLKSRIFADLLPIKVKEQYRSTVEICYGHNLLHNIINHGILRVDDLSTPEGSRMGLSFNIDTVSLDINLQYYIKNSKRKEYIKKIGNVPMLQNWSDRMPGMKLEMNLPFYYSRNSRVCLRTLKGNTNISHHFKFRNKIKDLIRMRIKSVAGGPDGNPVCSPAWEYIECNLDYLDIPNNATELPIPELWNRYAIMTDYEREWQKSLPPQIILMEDIFITTTNTPNPLGSVDINPLRCKDPMKFLFWVGQDVETFEKPNSSNYTTDVDDLMKGFNPCSVVDLKYGPAYRIEKMSHEHFETSEAEDFFESVPTEPGYNVLCLGYEPDSLCTDTGIILDRLNATLHIKVENTDPTLSVYSDNNIWDELSTKKKKYIIHVRGMIYKKVEVGWDRLTNRMRYTLK